MSSSSRFITPTYQSNLNAAIRDTVVAMNHGDFWGAWECLKTLYYLSPPKVEEECKGEFDKIEAQISKVLRHGHPDAVITQVRQREKMRRILVGKNRRFLAILKNSLFKHRYLERLPLQPRAKGKGKLVVS